MIKRLVKVIKYFITVNAYSGLVADWNQRIIILVIRITRVAFVFFEARDMICFEVKSSFIKAHCK